MNDFQRIEALCADLERTRVEIVKLLEEVEAARPPPPAQTNEDLIKRLEESIALLLQPQSIEAAVKAECEGLCLGCTCGRDEP